MFSKLKKLVGKTEEDHGDGFNGLNGGMVSTMEPHPLPALPPTPARSSRDAVTAEQDGYGHDVRRAGSAARVA